MQKSEEMAESPENVTVLGPHQISRAFDRARQPRLEAEGPRRKRDSQSEDCARSSSFRSNVRVGCSHDHFDFCFAQVAVYNLLVSFRRNMLLYVLFRYVVRLTLNLPQVYHQIKRL